jgi:hypothetical protein
LKLQKEKIMPNGHGGARPHAGRKKGSKNKSTIAQGLSLSALAQNYAPEPIEELVRIMQHGDSGAARMSAANSLLDRGFGKAAQSIDLDNKNGRPFRPILGSMSLQEAAAAYAETLAGTDGLPLSHPRSALPAPSPHGSQRSGLLIQQAID